MRPHHPLRALCAPLFALGAPVLAAGAQEDGAALLAHSFAAGQRFGFAIAVDSTVELAGGEGDDSAMHIVTHFRAAVGDVDDRGAAITCTLWRIEASVTTSTVRIRFDSADENRTPGPLQQLSELVGQTFRLRVGADGALAAIEVPPALTAATRDGHPADLGAGMPGIGADFDALFAAWFAPLPRSAVAVGSCWQQDVPLLAPSVARPGPVPTRHRLQSLRDGRAAIARTFELPEPVSRPDVRFTLARADGELQFDVANGRTVRNEMLLEARAERTPGAGSGAEARPVTGISRLHVVATAEPPEPPASPTPRDAGR